MTLPEAIRAIRRRRKQTTREFGLELGSSHVSVVGWESGRTPPRKPVLFRLMELAQSDEEKLPIRKALGFVGTLEEETQELVFNKAFDAAQVAVGEDAAQLKRLHPSVVRFKGLASQMMARTVIPDAVNQFLGAWLRYENSARFRRTASALVGTMATAGDIDAQRSAGTLSDSPRTERKLDVLQSVWMFCTYAKDWFDTGHQATKEAFQSYTPRRQTAFCPYCNMTHYLDKAKLRLQ